MKKDYTKLYDNDLISRDGESSFNACQGKSGKWHRARPLRYKSIFVDIRNAWNVLIRKADALYWTIDEDK